MVVSFHVGRVNCPRVFQGEKRLLPFLGLNVVEQGSSPIHPLLERLIVLNPVPFVIHITEVSVKVIELPTYITPKVVRL